MADMMTPGPGPEMALHTPQGNSNPAIRQLEELMAMRRSLPPSPLDQERQKALEGYQQTLRTQQTSPNRAFLDNVWMFNGNPMDGLMRAQQAHDMALAKNQEQNILAAKTGYADVSDRAKLESGEERAMASRMLSGRAVAGAGTGKFVPVAGVPGMMLNNVSGQMVDMRDAAAREFLAKYINNNAAIYGNDEDAFQSGMALMSRIQAAQVGTPATAFGKASPAGVNPAATQAVQGQQPAAVAQPFPDAPAGGTAGVPDPQGDVARVAHELVSSIAKYHGAETGDDAAEARANIDQLMVFVKNLPAPEQQVVMDRVRQLTGGQKPAAGEPNTQPAPEMPAFAPRKNKAQEAYDTAKGTGQAKSDMDIPQDTIKANYGLTKADELIAAANDLMVHPGLAKVTGAAGYIPLRGDVATWRGSDAANFKARLESFYSRLATGALQAMRDSSPTGGALGNVTERELDLLKNNLEGLSHMQDPNQYRDALKGIVASTQRIQELIRKAHSLQHPDTGAPQSAARETKVVAGKAYEKREDGLWYPKR